jgi:hypothetical protein
VGNGIDICMKSDLLERAVPAGAAQDDLAQGWFQVYAPPGQPRRAVCARSRLVPGQLDRHGRTRMTVATQAS